MARPGPRTVGLAALLLAAASFLLLAFTFSHQGLEQANQLAGTVGLFVNILATIGALVSAHLAWKSWQMMRENTLGRETLEKQLDNVTEELFSSVYNKWEREERVRRVHDPFPLPVEFEKAPAQLMDHWQNITDGANDPCNEINLSGGIADVANVLIRLPRGRLVVLGQPGSGKTILAIRAVLDLIKLSHNHRSSLPVLFALGLWNPGAATLEEWLVERLSTEYPQLTKIILQNETIAKKLLQSGKIIPVLDGFDELNADLRPQALIAINDHFGDSGRFLLTSRELEYANAVAEGDVISSAAVVKLKNLQLDDVLRYLPLTSKVQSSSGGKVLTKWTSVLEGLAGTSMTTQGKQKANLSQVFSTPLMVSLARAVYSDTPRDPAELLDTDRFPDRESIENHLLDALIPGRYAAVRSTGSEHRAWTTSVAQTSYETLAAILYQFNRTEIAWWWFIRAVPRKKSALLFGILGTILGVILALHRSGQVIGLHGPALVLYGGALGALAGASSGAGYRRASPLRLKPQKPKSWIEVPVLALISFFLVMLVGGIGQWVSFFVDPRMPGIMKTDLLGNLTRLTPWIAGLAVAISIAANCLDYYPLSDAVDSRSLLKSDRLCTLVLMTGAFSFTFVFDSIINHADLWDAVLLATALATWVGLPRAWFRFTEARIWFCLSARMPWAIIAFLDDGQKRGILRQVGPLYEFRHALLQSRLVDHATVNGRVLQAPRWSVVNEYYSQRPPKRWLRKALLNTRLGLARSVLGRRKGWELGIKESLGRVYMDEGDYQRAEAAYRRVIQLAREENSDYLGMTEHNLALVLLELGKVSEAEAEIRQVIADRQRIFGRSGIPTLNSQTALGNILRESGRLPEAEEILKETLRLRHRILGSEHPDTLETRYCLASVQETSGNLSEVESEYQKILASLRRMLGEDAELVLSVRLALGRVIAADPTRLGEAEKELRSLFRRLLRISGKRHPDTLECWFELAKVRKQEGCQVKDDLGKILALQVSRLGLEHPQSQRTCELLKEL
jgi:tetratricopeptide (TPR) repeat protein